MAVLDAERRAEAEGIKARYPTARSALMPLLYLVQSVEGHVSREGLREVADLLGLTTADVEAVATFYSMYRLRACGRFVLSVCTNVSCALLGAKELLEAARSELGAGAEEVTGDGAITLHEEECLGACEQAPVLQVNYLNYARMTRKRLLELIESLRAGEPIPSTQGPVPGDLKQTSRVLAGLGEAS